METVSGILLVLGALFVLIASVGALRFDSIYPRMHAAAKAPTLAIILIGIGTALAVRTTAAVVVVSLVVVFQLIAGPVGAHLLGRAVYRSDRPRLDGPDELAAHEPAEPDPT